MKINGWNEFRGRKCLVLNGSRIRGLDQQNNQRLHSGFSEGQELNYDLEAIIVHTFTDINAHIIQFLNDSGVPKIAWCYHTEIRFVD